MKIKAMKLIILLLSIILTWDLDKTGASNGYRVYYTQGGRQYVGTTITNRFTIEDTISGRSYKAYVTATNRWGESGKSRIITVVNP